MPASAFRRRETARQPWSGGARLLLLLAVLLLQLRDDRRVGQRRRVARLALRDVPRQLRMILPRCVWASRTRDRIVGRAERPIFFPTCALGSSTPRSSGAVLITRPQTALTVWSRSPPPRRRVDCRPGRIRPPSWRHGGRRRSRRHPRGRQPEVAWSIFAPSGEVRVRDSGSSTAPKRGVTIDAAQHARPRFEDRVAALAGSPCR